MRMICFLLSISIILSVDYQSLYYYDYYSFRFVSLGVFKKSQGCANLKHFVKLNLAIILRVIFRTKNDNIICLDTIDPYKI